MSKTHSLKDYKNDILLFAKELCGAEVKGYQRDILRGFMINRASKSKSLVLFPNLKTPNKRYEDVLCIIVFYGYFMKCYDEYVKDINLFNKHVEDELYKL
ncbi:hypothetical protein [Bacillus wiedmannii]|uniref:hypothetical protein n=1 Tax=Bacillus wiedmannii TaxID=1890302 RepID=UPI003D22C974